MSLTTQDFEKTIDITGLENVTGSELNQLIDVARTAEDKGLIIETTDSAARAAVVPDPNTAVDGITPTWWKRYIWKRYPHADDTDRQVRIYVWDDSAVSIATFLKWQNLLADGEANADSITELEGRMDAVEATANAATTAITNLTSTVNTNTENITDVQADVATLATQIATVNTNVNATILVSEIRMVAGAGVYSNTEDQGFLNCYGQAVSRSTFANLFAAIGTRFGLGDGSTTFNVPDCRGVFPVGAGTHLGVGRSADVVDAELSGASGGTKEVTLTAAQSGLPAHSHLVDWEANTCGSGSDNNTGSVENGVTDGATISTHESTAANATIAHTNLPPYLSFYFIIKT